jgi:hypothetical protein
MRLRGGLARMRGRASSWMADGRSNPISKMASRRYFGRSSSWNVRAEDRCEDVSDCMTLRLFCLFSCGYNGGLGQCCMLMVMGWEMFIISSSSVIYIHTYIYIYNSNEYYFLS